MKKAQHAVEGMIVLGVVFLIFFFLFFLYQTKSSDVGASGKIIGYRDDCQKIATAITNTYILGPNAQMILKTKNKATIEPRTQRVEVNNSVPCTFPINRTSDSTGSTAAFTINPGQVKFYNQQNIVVVSNG